MAMDRNYIQSLRDKLQNHLSRLNSINDIKQYRIVLSRFYRFLEEQILLKGIIDALLAKFPDITSVPKSPSGDTTEEAAARGYYDLKALKDDTNTSGSAASTLANRYGKVLNHGKDEFKIIGNVLVEPLFEYLDESIDRQRLMLALLKRYKHRSEWFYREELSECCENGRVSERKLALDLYSYLYDQGIDFMIEPSSITGEVDMIVAQENDDPLLVEVKVFDDGNRDRRYLRKGFNQIYTYTQQHNEPFGYLVIFKTCEKDLRFSFNQPGDVPLLVYNHKTIYFITIDIYPHPKPVSQRPPMKAIEITEEELVEVIKNGSK